MIWGKFFSFFKGENYVQKSLNKFNDGVLRKNEVDTYGAPVFTPDRKTTSIVANLY